MATITVLERVTGVGVCGHAEAQRQGWEGWAEQCQAQEHLVPEKQRLRGSAFGADGGVTLPTLILLWASGGWAGAAG